MRPDVTPDTTPDAVLSALLRLAPRLDRLTAEGLRRRGLTDARARVVLAVGERPATMTELSRQLEVTPRAVTALVDGLEELGLARRNAHPSDRRVTVVELTATGARLRRDMHEAWRKLAAGLLGSVAPSDLTAAARVLDHVREELDARAMLATKESEEAGTE
ncbi:MAG: MarR family transcriptional regulator [Actinobacteria bacterium]|nr:MarR family transcriptional regulator [Actinomycetota bacterium]